MLNISEELKQIYRYNNIPSINQVADIQLDVYFSDLNLHIRNDQIVDESFELSESLCSESDLTFGACESAQVKFTVADVTDELKGNIFTITQIVNGTYTMPLGTYKVDTVKRQDDLRFIDIVAYDAIQDFDIDVSQWYNSISYPLSIKQFRLSLCQRLHVEVFDQELCNDDFIVEKTIEPTYLKARDVLTAIGEINCACGHMTRDNKFKFIEFDGLGLYPSEKLYPYKDLYPQAPDEIFGEDGASYISCSYEDYIVEDITGIQIRAESGDAGIIVGDTSNVYIVEANFLCYGKPREDLKLIANKMLVKAKYQFYRPHQTVLPGLPYLEVGDSVIISKNNDIIESYVFSRTLKGIHALTDEINATGEQWRTNEVSANTQIEQLKGKTAIITRDVNGVKVYVEDLEQQTNTKFEQTADSILQEVNRATEKEGQLSSKIEQTAEQIMQEVSQTASNLSTRITQNAQQISLEANRATEAEGELSSKIIQTADSIETEVTRANKAEEQLSSKILQNAEQISIKVSKGDVSSEISTEAGQVRIMSNRLIVDSTNFKLDENGNAIFSGNITGAIITGSSFIIDNNERRVEITNTGITLTQKTGTTLFKLIDQYGREMSLTSNGMYISNDGNIQVSLSMDRLSVPMIFCENLNGSIPVTIKDIPKNTHDLQGTMGDVSGQIAFNNVNAVGWDYAKRTFATKSDVNELKNLIQSLVSKGSE